MSRGTLTLVVLLMACVFLLVGWLQSSDFQVRAIRVVEAAAERQIGEQVTLSRVSVRFWPPGVDVEGLHVFHDPTGETILSAERVRAPLAIRNSRPAIGQLQLQAPTVHLHVEPGGGLREFRSAQRGGGGYKELPFSRLRITDGEVRLDHPDGFVEIDDLDVTPTTGGLVDVTGTLGVRVRGYEDRGAFVWPGVEIRPHVVSVPALALDTRAVDTAGSVRWEPAGALAADVSVRFALDGLAGLLTPPRALHGELDADLHVEGTAHDPTLVVTAAATRLGVDVPGVFTPLLTYELGDLTTSVVVHGQEVRLEQLVVHQGEAGRIVAWGVVDRATNTVTGGHVSMQDLELEPLLRAFDVAPTPYVDFLGDVEIACEGTLKPLHLAGTFDLSVADLRVGDRPIRDPTVRPILVLPRGHATGTLVLEHDHIHVEAPTVHGPRSQGSFVMDVGFGPRGPLDLRADLFAADLEDFAPLGQVGLKGRGRVGGRIWGPFKQLQLEGFGDVIGFEVLRIPYADHLVATLRSPDMKSLSLENAVATFGSSRYHGRYGMTFRSPMSMTTDLTIDEGRVEDLVHMFVDLDGLTGRISGGRLTLDGPLYDLTGEGHLRFADVSLYGERFPVGEAHGFMDHGVFTLDDLRVRRDEGRAGVTLRGTVDRRWKLDMELLADGLTLEALDHVAPYELPVTGRVSGHARITNTLFDPSPAGRIVMSDVRYGHERAEDSIVDFASTDGVAQVTARLLGGTAVAVGTVGLWKEQPYRFDVTLDAVPAHLLYPTAADGTPITALVSGDLDLSGHFGETWSPVTLRAGLSRVSVGWSHHALENQRTWIIEQDGRSWSLRDVGLADGTTDVILERASGGDTLDLKGGGVVDLDLLRAVVPGLTRADGTATVTRFEAQGTKPNVQAVVELDIAADLLRHSGAPVTFEDARARLRITENRIEILDEAEGNLGGGTWLATGHIDAASFVPLRYDLALEIHDAQVQWVETLPPAIGDAYLKFDGPAGALLLSGDPAAPVTGIRVDDMTFTDRIDWEDWVVAYSEEMLVDPTSATDEAPLFSLFIPIKADHTIRLRNNVAEATASADLQIIGDTARPGLTGTVTIDEGGIAFLQDREFRLDRGVLSFDDPWSWDPQLDLSLVTDIESRDQRYRVDYDINGPFSDWYATARSDPPMDPADVNALLWFGMTIDDLEARGEMSSAVVQSVTDLVVTDFFLSNQTGVVGDIAQGLRTFDRIDLTTGLTVRGEYSPDPRLLVEKRLRDVGDVDIQSEFNLVRAEDYTLMLSRRIGGIWSLSGWYSVLQRSRQLPIGGAYGVDVSMRVELE